MSANLTVGNTTVSFKLHQTSPTTAELFIPSSTPGLNVVFTFDSSTGQIQTSSHILDASLGFITDTSGPSSPTFQRVVAVPV